MSSINDRLFRWFIRNLVIPGCEKIDEPGFIIEKMNNGKENREIFLPEELFVDLEIEIVKKYGLAGKSLLYSAGKKFGYNYFSLSVPTLKQTNNSMLFNDFLIKSIESIYASEIDYLPELEKKKITFRMTDFVICRKSGLGCMFSTGAIAGGWAYILEDKTIEAVQTKCQGRGDEFCETVIAPSKEFEKMDTKTEICTNLTPFLQDNKYIVANKLRKAVHANMSLKKLIKNETIEYAHGQVTYKNKRFFLVEASFIYILEYEFKNFKNSSDMLWRLCFEYGKKFANLSDTKNLREYITTILPAFGFGDILLLVSNGKYTIQINYFPYNKLTEKIDFVIIRGILSGIVSTFEGKKIEFKKIKKYMVHKYLSLIISN